MSTPYACCFVADWRSVSLVEVSASESERKLRVSVAPGKSWEVVLPIWCLPCIAILSAGVIAVWSVTRLFVLSEGKDPVRADFDDEIRAVYSVDGILCIVAELSIFIYDPGRATIVSRWQANDVLRASWWEGDKLMVESSSGTPIMFRPSAEAVGYLGL